MKQLVEMFLAGTLVVAARLTEGAWPGDAPQLPLAGTRIVRVATESDLQAAMGTLRSGDTILLADGAYPLTSSLYINGKDNVTIRGMAGSTNVVLMGKGMDNANYGNVPFGVWSNGKNTTIAHLTIRDTYDNELIFNAGAQSPHVYCVRLLDSGSQFIKSNPTDVDGGVGVNDGVVEYCWFEYTTKPPADHGAGIGYFNGISAHAAQNWIVRGNLFKNLHNPDTAAYLWNPAVLFWRHSAGTITEQNTFINADRAVAYGLDNTTRYFDHAGGVIRNNFVLMGPMLLSSNRKASSDGSIIAWNSPGTQIDHNTFLLNGNEFYAIEFRFSTTTNGTARNNLADAPVHLRDGAGAELKGNLSSAVPGMFVNPAAGNLHLLPVATNAINKASALGTVTNDFDCEVRPHGAGSDIGADEFTSNTGPVITRIALSAGSGVVSFTTVLGLKYELERTDDLIGDTWSVVAKNIHGTGGIAQDIDPDAPGRPKSFYRVGLAP